MHQAEAHRGQIYPQPAWSAHRCSSPFHTATSPSATGAKRACPKFTTGSRVLPKHLGGKFFEIRKLRVQEFRHLPLPPLPGRRRQPHLGSSPYPCATPLPILPLPCSSARRIYERQPRPGSRCLLQCPLFHVRLALLPTVAPPAALLLLPQPGRQTPPSRSALSGSVLSPMRGRGFLCIDQQPCRDRFGAGPSIPGCRVPKRRLLWYPAPAAARPPLR